MDLGQEGHVISLTCSATATVADGITDLWRQALYEGAAVGDNVDGQTPAGMVASVRI